ncbi:hypothetical protein [Paenibacillus hexagrammi]|uniref:Uncharacterized protein n=1 Tax=Paenibacillus hexagrammi TaxID=2908839 RepID=A0ABY3SNL9_9BACL|nr:hypothetical protein [Paenibacillus sp. YPD9-1]UJF35523.1 hypothetical protein L0M14_10720 [Paenibacillus sp. YPD9-1]
MRNKVLPLSKPIVDAYPYHANLQSVILNIPESMPWILNNYVQLHTMKLFDNLRLDYYNYTLWKTCPWIYYQRIGRDIVLLKWDSIVNFLIEMIESGFYSFFMVDVSQIPSYDIKGEHDIFIFGFDLDRKVFYAADNFQFGKYQYKEISFEQIEKGYNRIIETGKKDYLSGIEIINLRQDNKYLIQKDYTFQVDFLVEQLVDYLNSKKHI